MENQLRNELTEEQATIIGCNLKIILNNFKIYSVTIMADSNGLHISTFDSKFDLIQERRMVKIFRPGEYEEDVLVYSIMDDAGCCFKSFIRVENAFKWIVNHLVNQLIDSHIENGTITFKGANDVDQ